MHIPVPPEQGSAGGGPEAPSFQPIGEAETAPLGFLDLCSRSPQDCAHWPDSDLGAIARQAIHIKLDLFHKAFSAPARTGTPVVLTVGAPPYLAYDWLPNAPVDLSVYTWPMPADVAALKDEVETLADQFAFGPVEAVFVPANHASLTLGPQAGRDLNLNWPAPIGLGGLESGPDLQDLLDGGTSTLDLSTGLPSPPSADAVAQAVSFRLSAQAGPVADIPRRQVVIDNAPASQSAASASPTTYPEVKLTPTQYTILRQVNAFVNRAIGFETDMDQYHVEDYWVAPGVQPGARGDCEDYALEKRRQLINLGFPAAAMSLAIVSMPQEKTHAVLIVTTTDADYVLDNLSPSIKVWHDTKYPWIIRQGAADDLTWFSLYPTRLAH